MKLYDLPAEASQLEMLLTEAEGELTPELEKRLNDFLQGGTEKIENAACVVRSLQAQSDACNSEAKRLKVRSASLDANSDRLKALMLSAVDGAFKGKVKTALFTIWGQDSPGSATFELAPDADLMRLPDDFVKIEAPTLDTGALYQAWKQHKEIPPEVVVTEIPGKRSLRMR